MNDLPIDNVEHVDYQDTPTSRGQLSNIHVIFGKPGHIRSYFGSGLRLALSLLVDQFPPKTDDERNLVNHLAPTPIDFSIDPKTLELSTDAAKLTELGYTKLLAASLQADDFGYFLSAGRSFDTAHLKEAIKTQIELTKSHQ